MQGKCLKIRAQKSESENAVIKNKSEKDDILVAGGCVTDEKCILSSGRQ
jgi:hypothetical protein